ncbi:early nodulin-like protein 19 [Aristolochia californica]|uniref:early nodulin-like protein 19 n=1 Tax=Aristolochia californica TaxID=171875 RepID=UPI0035D83C25
MSASGSHFGKFLLYLLIVSALYLVEATDHIVGSNRGWNPGINYTSWVNNQTFYVNDYISFRYQKSMYNVFMVNESGYDNCTTEGALGNWSSGKDFILLTEPKRYYFICGNGLCFNGMKVSVVVHPLPPPPSSAVEGKPVKNSSSGGSALRWGTLIWCLMIFLWWM